MAVRQDFLDTNVLVYAFSQDAKSDVAEALLRRGCLIGVQCLNEFSNVARRKLKMSWEDLRKALDLIQRLCPNPMALDLDIHRDALRLAERHGFAMFDALIVATALRLRCLTLWSEDMQHGMVVEDRLTILNPFRADAVFSL